MAEAPFNSEAGQCRKRDRHGWCECRKRRSCFRPAAGSVAVRHAGQAARIKPGYNCRVDDCNFDAACCVYTQVATATSQGDPMRTFVLVFVFVIPALAACSAAWAKAPADIGKPVCTHYDDNAKAVARATADATVSSAPTATTTATTSVP